MNVSVGNLLQTALARACAVLPAERGSVPLDHWNESVFRWLLIRHLLAGAPGTPCWSEWHRVDLVIPSTSGATLVELKFFAHRPLRDHSGRVVRLKGGPSDHNVGEFWASIDTLANSAARHWARACGGISAGYFVLAYCDPVRISGQPTYGSYYKKLKPEARILSIEPIVEELPLDTDTAFTCQLLTVRIDPAA